MFSCKICNIEFDDLNREPVIHIGCGHTTCNNCAIEKYTKCDIVYYNYKGCRICKKPCALKLLTFDRVTDLIKPNAYLQEIIPYMRSLYNKLEKIAKNYFLTKILTHCEVHKLPITGYSVNKMSFICKSCIVTDNDVFEISNIIKTKYKVLEEKEKYFERIDKIKSSLDETLITCENLNNVDFNNNLTNDISKRINEMLEDKYKDKRKNIDSIIYDQMMNIKNEVSKQKILINKILETYKKMKIQINDTKANCNKISACNYNFTEIFDHELNFDNPIHPEYILVMYDKFIKCKRKRDYNIRLMFTNCLDKIINLGINEEYRKNINEILEEEYKTIKTKRHQ